MTVYRISIEVEGHDKASRPLGNVQNALGGLGSIVGGILGANILTTLGRQIIQLGKDALDSYASYERLGMSLQSLVAREMVNTGAAKDMAGALDMAGIKSEELLGWISKVALKSPFTQDGIAAAFKQSMAYGFTADESMRLTQAMVDFAAGSGATDDSMGRISLALGQIRARGKLAGQEINQLTEAGIPVRQILAKAFGVTTGQLEDMVSSGLVPADKAIQAITESLEKDFGGAAARQAGTFSGLVSSLEDIKSIGLRTFFEGTFKAVQPYVQSFVDKFSDPKFLKNLEGMGNKLGQFVSKAIVGFQSLRGVFDDLKKSPIATSIARNFEKIFSVLSNPTILAAAKKMFEGIKAFLSDLGAKVLPWAVSMIDKFGKWFVENGPLITAYITEISDRFTKYFLPALMIVWDIASTLLSGILDLILGIVKMSMQLFTGDWKGAWDTFLQVISGAAVTIWNALMVLFEGIARMMGTSLSKIGAVWSNNWNMLKSIVSQVWAILLATISGKLEEIKARVSSWITNLQGIISQKIAAFRNLGTQIVAGLQAGITGAWTGLISKFQGLVDMLPASVKTILGIASPSKLFIWFGKQIMLGLSKGIEAFSALPRNMLNGALSGVAGSAGRLSNYQYNNTDQSQKYYGPVTNIIQQPAPQGPSFTPVRI